MSSNKVFIFTIAVLLGCAFAQRVTLPLQFKHGQISIAAQYGSSNCTADLVPKFQNCSNAITQTYQEQQDHCGATTSLGYDNFTFGNDFTTSFDFGTSQANLTYTVPDFKSLYYEKNQLCFGLYNDSHSSNIIHELLSEQKISEEVFYINLQLKKIQIGNAPTPIPVGSIDIGEPDSSLIVPGYDFEDIPFGTGPNSFYLFIQKVRFYGSYVLYYTSVTLDIQSAYTQVPQIVIEYMLRCFDNLQIEYTYLPNAHQIYLTSIDKLESFDFIYWDQDNFQQTHITLSPKRYTTKISENNYLVLLTPSQDNSVVIGNGIFESYYIGFSLPSRTFKLAYKVQESSNEQEKPEKQLLRRSN